MQFQQHFSGSKGNFYTVTSCTGKRLLIECGVTSTKMFDALNYNFVGIEGCLCSHAHKDHSGGMSAIMESGIDVYANAHTFKSHGFTNNHRANIVENKTLIKKMPSFDVFCFDVNHDVPALGFVVKCDGEFLLFVTDTSHLEQRFKWQFSIIAIECNYDKDILNRAIENEAINEAHAKRLLESHMEKSVTIETLKKCVDMSKCHELHLLHMSAGNIDAEKTRAEFKKKFFIEPKTVGD